MGYEYDFVFDWMVKKANPSNPIKPGEEEKQEENVDIQMKMQENNIQ